MPLELKKSREKFFLKKEDKDTIILISIFGII